MELKSCVSTCRFWQTVGDTEQLAVMRDSLQSLYDWFTEGFDIVGLQVAKVLLNQLAADEQD